MPTDPSARPSRRRPIRRGRLAVAAPLVSLALVLAACSSPPSSTLGAGRPAGDSSSSTTHGTANVVYAGSLEQLVQTTLEPGFAKATGDGFVGKGAGSLGLAQSILDGELSPGVFVSVGAKPIQMLWPRRSSFVMGLATDPLVVAYSPHSRYAAELDRIRSGARPLKDLFSLFEQPGFRLGRTDPNTDPQGQFFIMMCELATKRLGLAADTPARVLGTTTANTTGASSQIFAETALDPQLEAGTVDAGSAYLSQALQYHLDYVALPPALDFADPALASTYASVHMRLRDASTVTGGLVTLDDTLVKPAKNESRSAGDEAADVAFLSYLLSPAGRRELSGSGYRLSAPTLELAPRQHATSAVPAPVLSAFGRLKGSVSTP